MKNQRLSKEELRTLNKTLEHTERAICLVVTIMLFMITSGDYHSFGRTFQVGLHEAVDELETRFRKLESLIEQISDSNK